MLDRLHGYSQHRNAGTRSDIPRIAPCPVRFPLDEQTEKINSEIETEFDRIQQILQQRKQFLKQKVH